MIGAAIVLVLCGLVFPITLLLLAVVFDVFVLIWAVFREWHDDVSPRIGRVFAHLHVPHLP
mgnify:CR=1 FL=1